MTRALEDLVAAVANEFDLDVGTAVVDLGSGGGERARLLAATGARVIAVEPSGAARAELARDVATVEIIDGAVDDLPLPEWTADLVVVADASVWLASDDCAAEIHRVLRPGGGLAVLADTAPAWPARVADLFGPVERREAVYWCRKP